MRRYRFEIVLAAGLFAAFLAFCLWQTPLHWRRALTPAERWRAM
jgi:hypothetical protein